VHAGSPSEVIGRRVAAALVDLMLAIVLLIVVGIAFGKAHTGGGNASVNLRGVSAVVFVIALFTYYATGEFLWGQTIGKRLFGIRVVSRRSDRSSPTAITGRTLLRAVDFFPLLYLVGFILILATGRRRQRLGDLVARTTVVDARADRTLGT
jgi:uncharacterized RDD family membrane protein YckC